MAKTDWQANQSRSRIRKSWRRKGRRRWLTPRLQQNRIFWPSKNVANKGPCQCARPRDASAARPIVFACHADICVIFPTSCPRPDGTSNRIIKENTKNRRGQVRKVGGVDSQRGGVGHGRTQEGKGTGKYQAVTNPLLLPKQRPEERSNGVGATNRCIKWTGRGRGVTYQATPRPWRTSDSRRSTGTGFTPTL